MKNMLSGKIYNKNKYLIVFLLVILLILLCILFIFRTSTRSENQPSSLVPISISSGNKTYNLQVETATTFDEQEKGLMFRKSLEKDKGMIFIFNSYTQQTFWMKNTLIPLDIMFFDINGQLLNIAQAEPCTTSDDKCELYPSNGPAKYVLEVNKGWAEEKNLNANSTKLIFNTSN